MLTAKRIGLWAVLALAIAAVPGRAEVLRVRGAEIRSAEDVNSFISVDDRGSYIAFPGTWRWDLEGSAEDYCAMSLETVVAAVLALDYPIENLGIEILILPVPRGEVPESSAEGRVVFLSPGRVPYPEQHIHYIVAHEIGHVVQHLLMPESRADLWGRYLELRGYGLESQGTDGSHAWRPAEVFAEDFRVLFGGEAARCGGSIENHDITPPEEVAGLREFMLALPASWDGQVTLAASPNPFEAGIGFQALNLEDTDTDLEVEICDIRGRVVTCLRGHSRGICLVVWDGSVCDGGQAAPGVYLAVIRSGSSVQVRKVVKRR
jgi:hypothetical protein